MAIQVKQIKYYNEMTPNGASSNHPKYYADGEPLSWFHFVDGTVFQKYFPIVQLGIQALPGTKFYLNNSPYPIIIGSNGYFEIGKDLGLKIINLNFDYSSMMNIKDNNNAYLIVDIVYDDYI